jgi:hypothetical protein
MAVLTLPDLRERAQTAIQCLSAHGDPSRGGLPYFYTHFDVRPAVAKLARWSYGDGLGRSVSSLLLLRCMVGGDIADETRSLRTSALLGLCGADGLSWTPAEPWTMPTPHMDPSWPQRGYLLALATLWEATGDDVFRKMGKMAVEGLLRTLSQHRELFLQGGHLLPGGKAAINAKPGMNASWQTVAHTAALLFFRRTNEPAALELGSKLVDLALENTNGGKLAFTKGHFHSDSQLVLALLLRGITKSSPDDVDLAEILYQKARSLGTKSGWFPERIGSEVGETCSLADMIECGILLALHRNAGYWTDVERYVRNHLLVHQITSTDWMSQHDHSTSSLPQEAEEGTLRTDEVLKHLKGGYAGYGAVTSFSYHRTTDPHQAVLSHSNQHCCNAAGARALYGAWRYGTQDDGTNLDIHLLLHRNRRAFAIRVMEDDHSLVLHIRLHEARRVSIRLPEDANPDNVKTVGNISPPRWEVRQKTRYLVLEGEPGGAKMSIEVLRKSWHSEEQAGGRSYRFSWKGDTVVDAEPVEGIPALFTGERFMDKLPELAPPTTQEFDSL